MEVSGGSSIYKVFENDPAYRSAREGEANIIDFSSYRQLHARFTSRNFSIKYVASGTENYRIKNNDYAIRNGKYLLTNAFAGGEITIDSERPVDGVCIELSPGLLAEVLAINQDVTSPYPQREVYGFLTSARFFEHDHKASETQLGRYLQQSIPRLQAGGVSDELYLGQFFYGIAEKMITDQKEIYKYLCAFEFVKSSTKKDMLARLLKGKEFMDDTFTEKTGIAAIAREAAMSEYYFLRLFKKVFNCSPHSYLVDKRLQMGAMLLRQGQDSIAGIAYSCGFADIQSFSKAFKKRFGQSPSAGR